MGLAVFLPVPVSAVWDSGRLEETRIFRAITPSLPEEQVHGRSSNGGA